MITREELIKILLQSNFAGRMQIIDTEIYEYMAYLQTKTDEELKNMLIINCG